MNAGRLLRKNPRSPSFRQVPFSRPGPHRQARTPGEFGYLLGYWPDREFAVASVIDMIRSIAFFLWIAAQLRTPDSAIVAGRFVSTEGMPVAGIRVIALETAYPR